MFKEIVLQIVAGKVSESPGPPTKKPRSKLCLLPTDAGEVERLVAAPTTGLSHSVVMLVGPIRIGLHAVAKEALRNLIVTTD
jgi:hypothetical protein